MHAVHHDVDVRMRPVPVRDHQRLVFGEAQVSEDAVHHDLHLFWRNRIGGIKVDGQVVHGRLDLEVGVGRRLHERGSDFGVVSAEVPSRSPRDAFGLLAGAAEHEVASEGGEAPAGR